MTIPLTFDWLTVAWLETRLALWWRSGGAAPRQLALLLLAVCAGCVPVTRFEETQSAAQVEMEGRRRSESQAAQLEAENAALQARLQQQGQMLDAREQALSQAALDSTTLGKQREDAEGMVQQLRGELARVGGHLQTFHDDQQKLTADLATEAARGRELSRLARDAALLLAEPVATGEYTLDAEPGSIVLRVPREKVFADDASVKPAADQTLKAVARLVQLHPKARLRIEDPSVASDGSALPRLIAALSERGVPGDRFEPFAPKAADAVPKAADAAPKPADAVTPSDDHEPSEIAFTFSVP